jgi:para-nitrobenzyl esterase
MKRFWRGFWTLAAIGFGTGVVSAAIVVLLVWGPPAPAFPAEPVRIEDGLVQGLARDGMTIYRGIPFAAPPVGDLRWKAPEPVADWDGVRKAYDFKPVCLQIGATVPGLAVEPMNEDCLYLNVWTPAEAADAKLPVMVWLYGGGNVTGSGSARLYWGDLLAEKGVVVVTLNYRLGVIAALAHPELTAEAGTSGNYHIQDEIAALRWVQRNIAAFGGDAQNVTIFGQSAGAHHASVLMASPAARGLFHKVMAHSGAAFSAPGTEFGMEKRADAEERGVGFMRAMGAGSLAELRRVPGDQLLTIEYRSRAILDGTIVTFDTYDAFDAGAQAKVPLLVGYNAAENPLPHRWPMWTWARLQARQGAAPVYFYYFDSWPPLGPFRRTGAGHGAELLYVFGYPPAFVHYFVESPWAARRHTVLGDEMRAYWTNFAKHGDPNGAGLAAWPRFNESGKMLSLGDVNDAIDVPDQAEHQRMDEEMARLRQTAALPVP